MKPTLSFPLLVCSIVIFFGCTKEEQKPPVVSQGIFSATINSASWQPTIYNAVYHRYKQTLTILATDNIGTSGLSVTIYLDSLHPEKNYILEPYGENVASFEQNNGLSCSSDYDMTDAGGNCQVISLDTANKKFSGNLSFTGHGGTGRTIFSATQIQDIYLLIDSAYDGNFASATIQVGSRNAVWQSKTFFAEIDCWSGLSQNTLGVSSATSRPLSFHVPLNNDAVPKQIYPPVIPYIYCGSNEITGSFSGCNAVSGIFNVTNVDTASRNMDVEFTMQLRDTVNNQDIYINNGQLRLRYWKGRL